MGKFIFSILLLLFPIILKCNLIKAIWVTPWECNTPAKVYDIIEKAASFNYSDLFVEVRYRGDALYVPNKFDSTNNNPEQRYKGLEGDFDPLQLFIDGCKEHGIKVHAWVTTFVYRNKGDNNASEMDYYYTYDKNNIRIDKTGQPSLYLDPGIEEVHEYLMGVFRDILVNYEIDGFHLDYIRLPNFTFGYHPESALEFTKIYNLTPKENDYLFGLWRRDAISRFLRKVHGAVREIRPDCVLSVAVLPDIRRAKDTFFQEWDYWDAENLVDLVVTMNYSDDPGKVKKEIKISQPLIKNAKYFAGLKAWSDGDSMDFVLENLKTNIEYLKNSDVHGFTLFSYSWLTRENDLIFREINKLE